MMAWALLSGRTDSADFFARKLQGPRRVADATTGVVAGWKDATAGLESHADPDPCNPGACLVATGSSAGMESGLAAATWTKMPHNIRVHLTGCSKRCPAPPASDTER